MQWKRVKSKTEEIIKIVLLEKIIRNNHVDFDLGYGSIRGVKQLYMPTDVLRKNEKELG